MKPLLRSLFAMALPHLSGAQLPEDSLAFMYKAGITGFYMAGNTVQTRIVGSIDVRSAQAGQKFGFWETGNYIFNNVSGSKAQRDLFSRWLFYYRTHPRLFPVLPVWVQRTLQLDYTVVSAGAGINYVLSPKRTNYLDAALFVSPEWRHYSETTYNYEAYNGRSDLNDVRLGFRVHGNHQLKDARPRLNYEVFFMPSLKWSDNYRIYGTARLTLPVYHRFALETALIYTYEQVVLAKRKQQDVNLSFGISYSNYQ